MHEKRDITIQMIVMLILGCMTIFLILSPVGMANSEVYDVKMMLVGFLILGLTINSLLLVFR